MKKYAVLKNVARGINFGVVVKSDIDQRFYGWSDKGIEWSDWANRNGGRLENLPIGVSVGEFKSLSDELLQKLIANSDDVAAVDHGVTRDLSRQILVKSERFNNSSKFPSVTTKSIPIAIWDKKIAVQYKVKHFKQSIARSEISLKVRHNELAFNVQTGQFNTKPNRASRLIERHDIRTKMSKGSERIFGGQIVDAINKKILSSERMVLTKRGNVGSHTKEVVDFFVKGRLGYSIGRAGRGGLRSMTPNRGGNRGLRGSASRVIAGVLDPRMRRDVDGDGMIFDGTWREMPDPTKLKPNLRTGLGGGRTTRNEIWKTRIVGKPQTPKLDLFDAFDAVQRVNDGDDLNSTFGDLWKAVKGRNDWGDLLTDVAAKLSVEKPNINGRNEKEIASSIKNIVNSSSSGLSRSKGHRYESSSLGSLTEYVARIATGKDADATDVVASFDDPYAPKGSKAHALEAMVAFGLGKLETPQSRRKYEGNRGFKSRTGSVIDDILYASEGAAEPEMDDLLRKVKMGMTLKQSESRSLLDSLKDIKNNNDEFLGDERLENLINHVSEMSSIGKDNNDLVSNLRFILRDRPDTKLSAMLDKYVNGEKMSDKERASFIQSLTGYAGSREFLDDDRITNLIDELKSRPKNSFIPEGRDMKPRGGNSIGVADGSGRADAIGLADGSGGVDNYTSRGGGVASRSMPAPDRERREGGAAPGGPPPPPNDDDDDKKPKKPRRDGLASSTGNEYLDTWQETPEKEKEKFVQAAIRQMMKEGYYGKTPQILRGDGAASSTGSKPVPYDFVDPNYDPTPKEEMKDFENYLDSQYGNDFMDYTQMSDEEVKQEVMRNYRMSRSEANAFVKKLRKDEEEYDDLQTAFYDSVDDDRGGGVASSTNTDPEGVIEELTEQADGANDSVSPLLRRAAKDVSSLTKPEQDELIEALNDEYNNGTMAGDKRLKDFIKYIQGTAPSGGTSRGRGVRSGTFKENITQLFRGDGLRSTTGDDDDLGSDMDDAIQAILKLKRGEKLTPEEQKTVLEALKVVKKPNADIDEDERVGLIDMESLVRSGGVASRSNDEPSAVKAARKMKRDQKRKLEAEVQMAEVVEMAELLQRWVETGDEVLLARLERKFQNHKWAEDPVTLKNGKPVNPNKNRNAALSSLEEAKKEMRSLRGVSSSTSARGPIKQNLTSRMATASTDRASRPRGLSSSTDTSTTKTPVLKDGPKKEKRKSRLIIDITDSFGKKKGEGDGVLWESLTDEQKAQAKEALAERKAMISKQLKTKIFKRWWQKATEEGSDKESLRAVRQRARGTGGKYAVRPADDPLTKDDIVDLLVTMDEQVSKGLLKQYKVDEKTNQIVLDKNGKPVMTETYANAARYLDDMMTILNMEEEDDFSLLEHLHTGSRQALHKKVGSAVTGKFKMGDSSVAGFAGGMQKATSVDELNDAELGKAKKLSIGKRLLRVNEARAAKARQRALRKTGSFRKGRILQSGDPELEMKRARLRARAGRRSMLSKFRRTRDADELSSDMNKVKGETSLIAIDNDGVVKISPRYVATLAKLDADLSRDRSSEENKSRVYDQLLADLWANSGFSGQPTLVTEDETRRLIAAGWQPVIRGTGSEEVNSESYVEQFLTDDSESRFIPGQGARAYGVGEYFAFPGSNWSGYRGSANQRHTILVLIPPSADIISSRELSKEKNKMQELTSAAVDALRTLGGREIAEGLTPGELAKTLRDAMPSLPQEKSRSAQIMSQLVDRLDELEGMPASTESLQEKKNILNSIDYLFRFTKQKDDGYFAPLIGVDAIDVNDGSGTASPLLLHNRAGVAAFQRPMTSEEAERLSKNEQGSSVGNVISTWATMGDRRRVVSATPESSGPRSKVGKKRRPSTRRPDPDEPTVTTDSTPAVQAPAVQAPGTSKSAVNTDTWTSSSPPSTGSNPATMLTDPNGTKYYAKLPKRGEPISTTTERMETEVLAGKLYALAGIPVADLQMGTNNGQPVMLSRMIQTRMPNGKGDNDKARDGFVVDAWLANWDAPLNDNIKVDNNGRPVRLDVGGSLDYRAQGAKKGSGGSTGFGPSVGEMTSMQKSGSSADFTNMDAGELKKQTQKLGTVTDDQIRQTVSAIVSDPARAKILADTLIARRDDIIKRYG